MRTVVVAVLLGGLSLLVPTAALPQSREAVLTSFEQTDSSNGANCQIMMQDMNALADTPRTALGPRYRAWVNTMTQTMVPVTAMCLQSVERETGDPAPAQVPRFVLTGACGYLRRIDPPDFRRDRAYCAVR